MLRSIICSINSFSGAEIVTYLPLQMTLYFNVFYSPLWLVTSILTLQAKVIPLALYH